MTKKINTKHKIGTAENECNTQTSPKDIDLKLKNIDGFTLPIELLVRRMLHSVDYQRDPFQDNGQRHGLNWAVHCARYKELWVLKYETFDFWMNLKGDNQPGSEIADAISFGLKEHFGETKTREQMMICGADIFAEPTG
jgi:hypothetical protein